MTKLFRPPVSSQSGFTLVELSIVFTIIGLLIAGLLRGQELIQNARVTTTVQQITNYRAAFRTFQTIYGYMPGDLPNPTTRLSNCGAGGLCSGATWVNCVVMGQNTASLAGDFTLGGTCSLIKNTATNDNTTNHYDWPITSERRVFWTHLAKAGLITGIDPESVSTTPAWNVQYPANKLGGGFHVTSINAAQNTWVQTLRGYYLVLRGAPGVSGVWNTLPEAPGAAAISPRRALQLDTKIDDGAPGRGTVVSYASAAATGCRTTYDSQIDDANCNLLIKLQN